MNQNRVPKGQPTGGEFAGHNRPEADTSLHSTHDLTEKFSPDVLDASVTVAAGGHNALLIGNHKTADDRLALVYQIAADQGKHVIEVEPHMTARALLGTGEAPGLLAQADNGILVVKEANDLTGSVLDLLRQPMETGVISFMRGTDRYEHPANFQLILLGSNCPCGAYSEDGCACARPAIRRYRGRISGPVLDRTEVVVNVPDEPGAKRAAPAALGAARRDVPRVKAVREAREAGLRKAMGADDQAVIPNNWYRMNEATRLDIRSRWKLDRALERGGITMRGYDRVVRVAWTLADQDGAPAPTEEHIDRALQLRGTY